MKKVFRHEALFKLQEQQRVEFGVRIKQLLYEQDELEPCHSDVGLQYYMQFDAGRFAGA